MVTHPSPVWGRHSNQIAVGSNPGQVFFFLLKKKKFLSKVSFGFYAIFYDTYKFSKAKYVHFPQIGTSL